MHHLTRLASGFTAFGLSLLAQNTISLHSGLVQYASGKVLLDGAPVQKTVVNTIEVKKGQTLSTSDDGVAEVLLTPGVFLRMKPNSSIRMDNNVLSDTQLAVKTGAVMVECDELVKGNAVTLTAGRQAIQLTRTGLARIDAQPAKVSVIKGSVFVAGTVNEVVKHGKQIGLDDSEPVTASFRTDKKDDLYSFSEVRARDNVYATGVVASSMANAGANCFSPTSSWYPMSGIGMYAYLPCNANFASPFGGYFLGSQYGSLYEGPGVYVPPPGLVYGAYGNSYLSNYAGGGGAGAIATASRNGQVRVPVYSGYQKNAQSPATSLVSMPQGAYLGSAARTRTAASAAGAVSRAPAVSNNNWAAFNASHQRSITSATERNIGLASAGMDPSMSGMHSVGHARGAAVGVAGPSAASMGSAAPAAAAAGSRGGMSRGSGGGPR